LIITLFDIAHRIRIRILFWLKKPLAIYLISSEDIGL
jgi:hypothetical protein